MREISITEVGSYYPNIKLKCYRCQVGCQTFAFLGKQELIDFLTKYINNPEQVEKEFYQAHPELSISNQTPTALAETPGLRS